jgi:hypothetical protein
MAEEETETKIKQREIGREKDRDRRGVRKRVIDVE